MKQIISLIILLAVFSCKNDTSSPNNKEGKIDDLVNDSTAFVKFIFPDTVYVNMTYKGEIHYKGVLDSITTNVLEKENGINRYIIFSLKTTKNINYKTEQLNTVKLDTFGAIDNRTIPFYDIKFTELGVNYIDGILNDYVTIDKANSLHKDEVRYIENILRATHKVVVIKKEIPKKSIL